VTPVAITAAQPFASLLAHGIAEWHTSRTRPRLEPGQEVWVHAGKEVDWPATYRPEIERALHDAGTCVVDITQRGCPWLGAVLSRHRLAEVVPIVDSDSRNDDGSGYDYGSDGPCIASGATNGFGDLTRWSSIEDDDWLDVSDQLPYADWSPGRWAWRLELIERLETPVRGYLDCCDGTMYHGPTHDYVPVRGRPGIWHPDRGLIAAVRGEG